MEFPFLLNQTYFSNWTFALETSKELVVRNDKNSDYHRSGDATKNHKVSLEEISLEEISLDKASIFEITLDWISQYKGHFENEINIGGHQKSSSKKTKTGKTRSGAEEIEDIVQAEKDDLFYTFMELTKNLDDMQTVLFETAYGYHAQADLYEGFYFQYPHLSGTLYLWDEDIQIFDQISGGNDDSSNMYKENSNKNNTGRFGKSILNQDDSTKEGKEKEGKEKEGKEKEGKENKDEGLEDINISREERNKLKRDKQKEEWDQFQEKEEAQKKADIEEAINKAFVDFDDDAYQQEQLWKIKNLERYFESVDDIVICTITSQRLYNSELSLDIVAEIEIEEYLHGEGDMFRTIHVPYVNPYIDGKPETVPPTVVETYKMLIFLDRFNRVVEGNGLFVVEGNHAFRNKKPNFFINPRLDRDWSGEMPFDEYVIYSIPEIREFVITQNNEPKFKKFLRKILR
jgi:hypothetical protein